MARGNTRDGFFFCLRVTHTTVQGNVFVENGGHGIGGLSDPDRCNAVAGNICAANGKHGIDAARSIGNVIQGNMCRNNSQSNAGEFAGIYLCEHRDTVVTGNVCFDDQPKHTQVHGIVNADPAGENIVRNNHSALET
jgi:parallel beta-helix repeat protein